MKEGDLITTYYKGFFRLKRIERRFYTQEYLNQYYPTDKNKKAGEEYSPLYYFTQEYDSNGNIKKSKEKSCDASFCELADSYIIDELQKLEQRKEQLLKLYGRNENY
jgi:hypothetical protein